MQIQKQLINIWIKFYFVYSLKHINVTLTGNS